MQLLRPVIVCVHFALFGVCKSLNLLRRIRKLLYGIQKLCIRTNGKVVNMPYVFIMITLPEHSAKVYFEVMLLTGRGCYDCINFSNALKSPRCCAHACVKRERKLPRRRDRGGRKAKNFHPKFVGSECLGEIAKMGTWCSSASVSVWFCLGATSSDSHPALNPQHESAARPPGPALGSPQDTSRLEEYVIFSRLVECVAVSGHARHSRSKADDGEELPELQLHRAGQRGGSERGLGLQTQVREGGSPPEENSGDGRPSETHTHTYTHVKVSRHI